MIVMMPSTRALTCEAHKGVARGANLDRLPLGEFAKLLAQYLAGVVLLHARPERPLDLSV
ncbi:MAG TPA: hypothetical protein VMW19_07400 [Myxococcota bacterium]|nr:hypothetical protein [Myxococcota bacterium]